MCRCSVIRRSSRAASRPEIHLEVAGRTAKSRVSRRERQVSSLYTQVYVCLRQGRGSSFFFKGTLSRSHTVPIIPRTEVPRPGLREIDASRCTPRRCALAHPRTCFIHTFHRAPIRKLYLNPDPAPRDVAGDEKISETAPVISFLRMCALPAHRVFEKSALP